MEGKAARLWLPAAKEIPNRSNQPYVGLSEIVRRREVDFMKEFLHFSGHEAVAVARHNTCQVITAGSLHGGINKNAKDQIL